MDEVDASVGMVLYNHQIDHSGNNAHQGQQHGVAKHQGKVKTEQGDIDDLRSEHLHERVSDGLIQMLALLQFSHAAHSEERDRQSQHMVEILHISFQCQRAGHPFGITGLQ